MGKKNVEAPAVAEVIPAALPEPAFTGSAAGRKLALYRAMTEAPESRIVLMKRAFGPNPPKESNLPAMENVGAVVRCGTGLYRRATDAERIAFAGMPKGTVIGVARTHTGPRTPAAPKAAPSPFGGDAGMIAYPAEPAPVILSVPAEVAA